MKRAAALLALASGMVVAASWPLATVMDDHLLANIADPDMGAGMWWTHTFVDCVLEGRNPFFREELAWPEGQDLRLLMWNIGLQVLLAPIHALFEPVLAMNLSAMAIGVTNGLACGWVAWRLTRNPWAAAASVVVGAGSIYAIYEAGVGRTEQGFWAPLAIWLGGLLWLREDGGRRAWILSGLGLGLAGSCYWFHAWFAIPITLILALAWRDLRVLGVLGVSLIVVLPSLALVAPAFWEQGNDYALMMERLDSEGQKMAGSLEVPAAFLMGKTADPARKVPVLLLPVLVFAATRPRLRVPALVGLGAIVMSLGPILVEDLGRPWIVGDARLRLPAGFLDWAPGHERFWWPYRWLAVALPAFAICLGGLVSRAGRFAPLAVLGVVLLTVVEGYLGLRNDRPLHHVLHEAPTDFPELDGPVLVWPPAQVANDLIGYRVFHDQPQGGGIAWDMSAEVRGPAWGRRVVETGLFQGLNQAAMGAPVTADLSDRAGYRYVLADRPGLERALGEPIWTHPPVALFDLGE